MAMVNKWYGNPFERHAVVNMWKGCVISRR